MKFKLSNRKPPVVGKAIKLTKSLPGGKMPPQRPIPYLSNKKGILKLKGNKMKRM